MLYPHVLPVLVDIGEGDRGYNHDLLLLQQLLLLLQLVGDDPVGLLERILGVLAVDALVVEFSRRGLHLTQNLQHVFWRHLP